MAKKKKTTEEKKTEFVDVHPAALRAYLDRIGAEVLSFRRAMVKERSKGNSYYIERTLIKIAADGEITCSRKEHDPTDEEQEAITKAYLVLKLPHSVIATKSGFERWLSEQDGDKERFFGLFDRAENGYRMVQERVMPENGEKYFVPWTLWSDGEWRSMEPDGLLPLWKPEKRTKSCIMIHEGCKSAKFVNELLKDKAMLDSHPWKKVLMLYEHWGMIGGALAPHRTNYEELKRERPEEVVYICDRDYPGESALQEVSRYWGQSLKGVKFGDKFPLSWDMAEEFPEEMFSKSGRFIGPPLEGLMQPATRATEIVPTADGKGKGVVVLRRPFKEEWIHAITPEVYINKQWPDQIYGPDQFNNKVAPFSDVDDTARFVKRDDSSKSAMLKYDPGAEPGVYGGDGRYINTHVPSPIVAEKGDIGPFLEFMKILLPIEGDREETMRWCATLIACPSVKMHYGLLMISETQGVGKTTLGEKILAPLMGLNNVSYPSESDIVESTFNYWLAHKRLAVVNEIYAGHSAKAYNKLKSIITDRTLTVNKKFMAAYEIENWMHIFACSNSARALQLSFDDRRWFVPKVTEEKAPFKFWENFNDWLEGKGGLGIIKHWANEWVGKNEPVRHGAGAPWSATKGEIVEEGYSPGMTLVARLFERINEELTKPKKERWTGKTTGNDARSKVIDDCPLVLDTDLVELIRQQIYEGRQSDRLEKPLTVRKVAKQKGWASCDTRAYNVPTWGAAGLGAKVLVPMASETKKTPGDFVKEGRKPLDVREFMQL